MTAQASLERIASEVLGFPGEVLSITLRPPLDHQSNNLYDLRVPGGRFILKEYLVPEEFDKAARREFDALKLLAPFDLAPKPVHYQPANLPEKPIVIYEFLKGEMWDRIRPSRDQLEKLAHCWLAFHQVPTNDLWGSRGYRDHDTLADRVDRRFSLYKDWVTAYHPLGLKVLPLWTELIRRLRQVNHELLQLERVEAFCRADPRFANVIERPNGRLGLVDWEDSGLRDPAIDVADMINHPNQEDLVREEDWEAFLLPYLSERESGDPHLRRRIHLCRFILPVFYLAGLLGHGVRRVRNGQLSGWRINSMDPNARLRRFLARALVWPNYEFAEAAGAVETIRFFPMG